MAYNYEREQMHCYSSFKAAFSVDISLSVHTSRLKLRYLSFSLRSGVSKFSQLKYEHWEDLQD